MFHARCSLGDTQGEIKTSGAKEVTLLEVKEEELEALAFGEKDDQRVEVVHMFDGVRSFVGVRQLVCASLPARPMVPFSVPKNRGDGYLAFQRAQWCCASSVSRGIPYPFCTRHNALRTCGVLQYSWG